MLFYLFLTAPNISRRADWVKKFETYGTVQEFHTKSEECSSHSG